MNAANALTVSRLALSLVYFVMLLLMPEGKWLFAALGVLVLAGLTDVFDGRIARARGEVTEFGRVADAYVDRVLACGAHVIFLSWGLVDTWVVLVIVVREFIVGGMRNLADARGLRFQATIFGKSKFLTQMAACFAVTLYRAAFAGSSAALAVMNVVVYVSAVNTALSGLIYLVGYRERVGVESG